MSKNFELLQQIGDDEELFRTAEVTRDSAEAEQFQHGSALDQDTFERIMEKASSIGLFQTSTEPPSQTFADASESKTIGSRKDDVIEAPKENASNLLRTPRNASSPIGDPEIVIESRARKSAAKSPSLPKPFPAEEKPKEIRATATMEPLSGAEVKYEQRSRQERSLPSLWLDSIKSTAKRWEREERAGSNQAGADAPAIAREEEIKLVERVFPGTQNSPRVVLFAGLEDEVCCGPTCARVAELLAARSEGPVCIVDANFQTPSLHGYFGMDNLKGLAEATVESGPIQNFAQQIPEPDLWLIPSGKAAFHLRFPAMADGLRVRMEELRETFRYVVIHSGRLRMETSAMLLSRWTDGVVLIVEANATRRDTARRVKEMLDVANVKLLGVVLNNRTFPIPEVIYRRF